MRLTNLTHYQRNKLTKQIQYNVAYNAKCLLSDVKVTLEHEQGYPDRLCYIDEDKIKAIEIGYKCDNCGTIYSSYEEPGELCECPNCHRPTYENW